MTHPVADEQQGDLGLHLGWRLNLPTPSGCPCVHVSDYTVLFDQVEDGRSRRRSFAVPAESSSPGSDHFDEVRGDWAVLQYDGSGAFGSPVGLWLQAPR